MVRFGIAFVLVVSMGASTEYQRAKADETEVRQLVTAYTDAWNRHDTQAFARVFTDDVDYVNIAGRHWKGVEENVREHAIRFAGNMKSAVQTPTEIQVRFLTDEIALVHTSWDVTGYVRPDGKSVPLLKEITTMVVVKHGGKWLITAFQNTERVAS